MLLFSAIMSSDHDAYSTSFEQMCEWPEEEFLAERLRFQQFLRQYIQKMVLIGNRGEDILFKGNLSMKIATDLLEDLSIFGGEIDRYRKAEFLNAKSALDLNQKLKVKKNRH